MIEEISPINNRILRSRIQEDPEEEVEMIPIEEVVEMVEDHTITTEGEIEEIATHQTPL